MSYLARPRIGFFSTDAMTNPSTGNNENVIHILDYDNVKLLNPPSIEGGPLPEMSDAAYREWMTTLITSADPSNDPTQPDWKPQMPGYWNYWGDHLTTFGNAAVTSIWTDDDPVTAPGTDPLLSANVVFNARIVDLNPADTFTTQFVAAGFSVIGTDIGGQRAELLRGVPTTAVTRWLNFNRYYGAGTFQAVIPTDGIQFIDDALAPASPGFHALRDGIRKSGGLLLRWCFYGMKTAIPILDLYDRFQEGEPASNPKVGRVVGSIGVWNGTDPVSVGVGRVMQQPSPPYFAATQPEARPEAGLRVKTHADVERMSKPQTLLGAQNAETDCAQNMGPAAAYVAGHTVVLDLNTAFPEAGCSPTYQGDPFEKHDFGTVDLEVAYGEGESAVLGPIRYDRATYEQLGGIWEVRFDPSSDAGRHVGDGWFRLRDASGTILLQEVEVPQIVTDDQTVYLDLDKTEQGLRAAGSVRLRAFAKGEPVTEPVSVKVEVWNDVQLPGEVNSLNPLVVTATQVTERHSGDIAVEVPAGGEASVPIEAGAPGCNKLRYIPAGMPVTEASPQWAVEYYSCFRVLPYDDYSNLPDDEITFDLVYREVFSYYAILYPVMGRIIPWGPENAERDPDRVMQFASLIDQAIDESRLGTALQMPITRELSAGKRALLKRWCSLVLGGNVKAR